MSGLHMLEEREDIRVPRLNVALRHVAEDFGAPMVHTHEQRPLPASYGDSALVLTQRLDIAEPAKPSPIISMPSSNLSFELVATHQTMSS